ncbi:MAG: sulfotransferase family 2 domain-containing protein, partial [Alphaproteobacteria bacterium]
MSVERNPWDRQVSQFYYRTQKKSKTNIDFNTFMTSILYRTFHKVKLNNFDIYSINNKVSADYMMRYETLNDDYAEVLKLIGAENQSELPRVKSNFRKKRDGYREYYDDVTKSLVEYWYSREIRAHSKKWEPVFRKNARNYKELERIERIRIHEISSKS